MVFHLAIILLQAAAVAAFLVLWYFWVKKKLVCSYLLEDDEQVLFPFRYFSWVLLGVVVVTCLAQVHFVRSSALVNERLASLTESYNGQERAIRALLEAGAPTERLRHDLSSLLDELRTQARGGETRTASLGPTAEPFTPPAAPVKSSLMRSVAVPAATPSEAPGFSGVAKAYSSRPSSAVPPDTPAKTDTQDSDPGYSMALDLNGQVTVDKLRVRKQPKSDAPIVERLGSGEKVKVTEKRLFRDAMWFRVVTPAGRSGWVDFRFIKLEGRV